MTGPTRTGRGLLGAMDHELAGTMRLLWSCGTEGGCDVVGTSSATTGPVLDTLLVLPSVRRGRFLVSDAAPGPTARVLASHNGIRSRRRAALRAGLARYLRSGLPRTLVGDRVRVTASPALADAGAVSFPARLRQLVDTPEALVALGVRDLDYPHAKPTVGLFTAHGAPLAYAKLGWSVTTADLVRHEAAALRRLEGRGRIPGLRAAALRLEGEWAGHPFVLLEPLPPDVRSLPRDRPPYDAMRAVAGQVHTGPVGASAWWAELVRRSAALAASSELATAVARASDVLIDRSAGRDWDWGAWHGDWTWWNVGRASGTVYAWDWEHAADCAPLGFDDLHWGISRDRQLEGRPLEVALQRSRGLPAMSAAGQPELLLLAYLTEMGVRSCEVARGTDGEPVSLNDGLLDALVAQTARLA